MSEKYFSDQLENEEVLMVFRKHPLVLRKGLVFLMICLLLGTIPSLIKPEYRYFFEGIGIGLLVGLLFFAPYWVSWFYSVFIVTNQRFIQITQKGLFHRSVVDISLNQIQMVNYEINGIQATLLSFGTIIIQTYMGDLIIHEVHHPARTQKALLDILRENGIVAVELPFEKGEEVE